MLSIKTCIEIAALLDRLPERAIDRIISVFDLRYMVSPLYGKFNKDKKVDIILDTLCNPMNKKGPNTPDFRIDMLGYLVDYFYRFDDQDTFGAFFPKTNEHIVHEQRFEHAYPSLSYSLRRDGYIVRGRAIQPMLPDILASAQTENELTVLLHRFNLAEASGHLQQAIANHAQGNWAAANGQLRPFVESLLIGIAGNILPANDCTTASGAIQLLSKTANPPFFRTDLNEVANNRSDSSFVDGFWKRLHPEGPHPGLSDEADCTFRYHIALIFAHYLLKRLEERLPPF